MLILSLILKARTTRNHPKPADPPETSTNPPKKAPKRPVTERNHPKQPDLGSFASSRVVSLVLGGFGWFRLIPPFSKISRWFRVVSSLFLAKFNFEAKITRNHPKPLNLGGFGWS